MVATIITTGRSGQVVAIFRLYKTKVFPSCKMSEQVELVQITGLVDTKGRIDICAWCHYSDRMRKMLTTLSQQGRVEFVRADGVFTGVIEPEEGKVRRMDITF